MRDFIFKLKSSMGKCWSHCALQARTGGSIRLLAGGDIFVAQVCRQRDNLDKAYLVAFEVAEIKGDTLLLRQGDKHGVRLRVYGLPEIRDTALEFVAAGNSFSSEAKPFTRPYQRDPERIFSPGLPDTNIDVKYVLRP